MQKLYNIVKVMLMFALLFTQNKLQAQKCCVECQADVKVVSDKQVLLMPLLVFQACPPLLEFSPTTLAKATCEK